MSNPGPAITSTPVSNDAMEALPAAASSGDGHYVGKSAESLVGFWGATPVAQQTFSGSTVGDLVAVLQTLGILAP